jgi:hypothetical protein
MSTTTNAVLAVTLTSAAFVGGALLIPADAPEASDGGIVDAGPQGPLIGNFYLRFPSEADFDREVRSTPFWQWETGYTDAGPDGGLVPVTLDSGSLITTAMGHNFDVVGTITRPIPGSDGGVETLDGWHVNFSGILPDAWVPYIVKPENPARGMR